MSGRSVALAHRVAVAQAAMKYQQMAGAAFLLPGLAHGYGKIEKRLGGIEGRLSRIERSLSMPDRGSGCSGGIEPGL